MLPVRRVGLAAFPLGPGALSCCGGTDRHVSGSFHMPHGILFAFCSNYCFSIGLRTYLGLGGLHSRIGPEISVRPTLFPATSASSLTGLSPSSVSYSKELQLNALRFYRHHICPTFRQGIRLGLCPFHSPLLRVSRLLSLPAPTMMLRFRAFPLGTPLD